MITSGAWRRAALPLSESRVLDRRRPRPTLVVPAARCRHRRAGRATDRVGLPLESAQHLSLAGIDLPGGCSGATGYVAGCGIRFTADVGHLAGSAGPRADSIIKTKTGAPA